MWDVNFVQFARLLDEINAVGLSKEQTDCIAKNMDVKPEEVKQLLERATAKWDELKPLLVKKTPLTEEQVSEELAEHGKVEAVVTMDFEEIIGQLEDVDSLFDDLAERMSTSVPLADLDYKVLFTEGDTLYMKVIGKTEDCEDEEEEEETVE